MTKAALLDAVWAGVMVSDSMPATCVAELRRALGDEAKTPRFIETVHGRGYRFMAKVTSDAPAEATSISATVAKSFRPIVVGREDELARLQSWYSHVLEGQRRVIFVAGEAGIGKTTFVQAFVDSIVQEGTARLGRGQCVEQYGAGEPYMPVLEALGRLGQDPGGKRVVELLNRFAPTWLTQMPALLGSEERVRLQTQNQGVTQQRMLREMAQALEALAAETPLVLVLEDLHWSDFSTLELISAVARRSEPARLLIVGTYRPVEMLAHAHPLRRMKEELELHRYCEELRLKLLSEEDVASYLAKRFSSNGSRAFQTLAPVIHDRTDGNPLFMINVVDYLVDAGLLAGSREASATGSAEILRADRVEVPRSVRQMIERNLKRLNPEEQAVLESASVAGAEFSAAAVAAALERPQNEVEACCARLSRREQFVIGKGAIAWPDGTVAAGFRFHHAMYQEVLYALLPPGHRGQLHRLIAVREEAGYGERAAEVATELAHHYSQANDKSKAIHYFRLAGERAVARGAVVEAEGHYRNALSLLIELPQDTERDRRELALQMALGEVLWTSKSWSHPDASESYARALQLAEKLGEATQIVGVLLALIATALGSGHLKRARELGERTLAMAQSSGDRTSICGAQALLGQALLWRGQYVDARKHLERGRTYYKEGDPGEWGLDACALAPIALLMLGYIDQARDLMNEALGRAVYCVDLNRVGVVHVWAGVFFTLLRDARVVIEHAQALKDMAAKQPVWSGVSDLCMSQALMIQGKPEAGIGYLRKAIAFHKEVSLLAFRAWERLYESEFLTSQGQIDDALALAAEAIAQTEEFAHLRSPALLLHADLLGRCAADASTIGTAYRAAIGCARSQGAKYYELQATTSFARWLKSQRRDAEAQTLLAEIYGWFTEGFHTPVIREAKALLDEMSSEPTMRRRRKLAGNP